MMAAELGTTHDPRALIPGRCEALFSMASDMTGYGDELHQAGQGLRRIDSADGWSGPASDQFRTAFDAEPTRWLDAGDAFHNASKALERYADALTWAQQQATEAIQLWDAGQAATEQAKADHAHAVDQARHQAHNSGAPPETAPAVPFVDPGEEQRQQARAMVDHARSQLAEAGDTAAATVEAAVSTAPEKPTWLEQAADAVAGAGAQALNAVASVGNAALHHPEFVLGAVGGAALTVASAAGEVVGVGLDATGAGAVAGAPLNVVSTAGIATGVGMMGVAMAGLASEAAGDDHVEVADTSDPPADTPPAEATDRPTEISRLTEHGQERAMGRDGHGVNDEAMRDAVANPVKEIKEQSGGKYKFVGKDATVVLGREGEVITTWARNANGWRH